MTRLPGSRGAAALVALLTLTGPSATWAQGHPQETQQLPRPAQIDRNGVLILIRSTLLALQHGNETGNYTVLRDLAAPGFHDANTAARLGEIFASQRTQKLDLSGVAVLDPQLTLLPQIESNGLLHLAGFFPSVPSQVNFELLFAPVDGRWRVFGISVVIGSAAPTAPPLPQVQGAPSPTPTSKPEPKPEPKHGPRRATPPKTTPRAGSEDKPVESAPQ
ncbi:hypothetical protein [Methylobacterium currus]|uniref:hypothetical protein n=1 Tax=Methylobacterium currus TaxID=2051553 RepID=UPI0039C4B016